MASGWDPERREYASAAAATYPERMNQAIANAIVALARASVGGSAACVETVDVEARRRHHVDTYKAEAPRGDVEARRR